MQAEGSGRAPEVLRWEAGGLRTARGGRPDRVQWPHCHHPLVHPKPAPQLVHGRITPPSLWEPAGTARRDPPRPQVTTLTIAATKLLQRLSKTTRPLARPRHYRRISRATPAHQILRRCGLGIVAIASRPLFVILCLAKSIDIESALHGVHFP